MCLDLFGFLYPYPHSHRILITIEFHPRSPSSSYHFLGWHKKSTRHVWEVIWVVLIWEYLKKDVNLGTIVMLHTFWCVSTTFCWVRRWIRTTKQNHYVILCVFEVLMFLWKIWRHSTFSCGFRKDILMKYNAMLWNLWYGVPNLAK